MTPEAKPKTTKAKPKADDPPAPLADAPPPGDPPVGAPQQLPGAAAVAILQADLTEVQAGLESTAGTLVAATRKLPFTDGSYSPTIDRKTLEERGTVLADTDDVVTSRGSELELTQELDSSTIILPMQCGLRRVSSSTVNSAREWVWAPQVTEPSALDTATFEIAETDGAAAQYYARFGFARPTSISIEASSETSSISTTWMGRAKQALTAPSSVDVPDRFIVPAMLWRCWIDDTWAGLGGTDFGHVRSFTLDIDPGLTEAPALAGRSDLDMAYWRRGRIRGSLSLVVDHEGLASGELAHWEAGDLRFVRLEADNGQANADKRQIRIEVAMRYIDTPDVLAADGAQHTLDLAGELRADGSNNILRVTAFNDLATF